MTGINTNQPDSTDNSQIENITTTNNTQQTENNTQQVGTHEGRKIIYDSKGDFQSKEQGIFDHTMNYSDIDSGEVKLDLSQMNFKLVSKQTLTEQGIVFDPKLFKKDIEITRVVKNKLELLTDVDKLNSNQKGFFVWFIAHNKEALQKIAQECGQPVYLRREVSGLPLNLRILPNGQILVELKKIGKWEPVCFGETFKKLYECIDYDSGKLYLSGSMKCKESNIKMINSEINYAQQMLGITNTAQIISISKYESKPLYDPKEEKVYVEWKIHFVVEYYPKGDLEKNITELSPQEKLKITDGAINGLKGIHGEKLLHLDIKLGNIFLDEECNSYIGDFGSVQEFGNYRPMVVNYTHIHPQFFKLLLVTTSIDTLVDALKENCGAGERFDIYSLGLVLAQLEKGEKGLPWDTLVNNFNQNKKQGVMYKEDVDDIIQQMEQFYDTFPQDTDFQKFIKMLINPDFNALPSSMEDVATLYQNMVKK